VAKVAVFYSIRETDSRVHHNNNACADGKTIESYVRSTGADHRPLCPECEKLSAEGASTANVDEKPVGFIASIKAAMGLGGAPKS
jgi:hypothetical protein